MKKEETVTVDTGLVNKKTPSMSCSRILNTMVLFGFMVNYMLRVNFTIAIVDMVPQKQNVSIEQQNTNFSIPALNNTNSSLNLTLSKSPGEIKFNWSEYEQNIILGSFFWGYVLTELPGGRMAEMIGARPVFGYSMLLASMVTLLTPMAAKIGYYCIIFCRVFLGFTLGVTWPAILPIAANWIPPNERSKFMANMMASTLGAAITLPICGILISAWGWESVFYITGIVGIAWCVMWFNLVFETPAEHPRISEYERNYIETQIAKQSSPGTKPNSLPWVKILTSLPVWAIIITHGASVFGYFTIVNQLPTYMKYLLHYNIKANGFLSSLPYLGKYLMALFAGIVADRLLNSEKISKTNTRKIFTAIGVFTPGILMIIQVYFGNNHVWSVLIFTAALTLNGAVTGGYLGNGLDIAPNFSGTIFGMANTLSSFGGYLSSYIVGRLTNNNQTFEQWRIVFWILAGTYMVGASMFLIFGTAKTLPWNSTTKKEGANGFSINESETLKPLKIEQSS
ncbi:sialin-like [Sipha flava]|uniref:Sialin-like n=3 Tax=Sipha flava TaxID=143950 RepID=A0A8B8GNS6_9HEMI|nr:sialin-like [Sipha flava]XP_025424914.1 sialin-like [Sipha flava]